MLSESEGCAVLHRVFRERGFAVQQNVPFDEDGVRFEADGWDPGARVGYEFMTAEAGDHAELGAAALRTLGEWTASGRAFFFIVDEADVADAEELAWAAGKFLDEVARRRGARG